MRQKKFTEALAKKSKRTKHFASNGKGKKAVESTIKIADDTDDEAVQLKQENKGNKLNLQRMKISNYLSLDIKSRLEALWDKTSHQYVNLYNYIYEHYKKVRNYALYNTNLRTNIYMSK